MLFRTNHQQERGHDLAALNTGGQPRHRTPREGEGAAEGEGDRVFLADRRATSADYTDSSTLPW